MQEILMGLLQEPLLIATCITSVVGLVTYHLYGGFIRENYMQIKWFRRLFLPHVTRLMNKIDEENEDIDLDGVYVESELVDAEHVFDLYLDESDNMQNVRREVGETLIDNHFRPEVLLASLATNPQGEIEVGNFVLTAPQKNHSDVSGYGRLYDIFTMFVSKYQLHVRIFYDRDKHRLRFYAHHELNPYNPIYSKRHLEGEEMNYTKGVSMFKKYKDEIAEYGVEVVE